MKKNDIYKDNPDYLTSRQSCEELGIWPLTFKRYVERYAIVGIECGRCTYYHRNDIETMRNFFSWGAQDLVIRLETMTGGKVTITMPGK